MHNRCRFFLAGNCSRIPFPLDNVCQLHVPRSFWTEFKKKVDPMNQIVPIYTYMYLCTSYKIMCWRHNSTLITLISIRWEILCDWSYVPRKFYLKLYPETHSQGKCINRKWFIRKKVYKDWMKCVFSFYTSIFL